jgi:hypothetical protein
MGIEQQELVEAFKSGLTYAQLAEKFSISRGQVSGKLFRLGLTKPTTRVSDEERKRRQRVSRSQYNMRKKLQRKERKAAWLADPNYKPPRPVYQPKPVTDLSEIALHFSFADLKPYHCRYPYGQGPFTFCGHGKADGSSYCAPHKLLCTEPRMGRGA